MPLLVLFVIALTTPYFSLTSLIKPHRIVSLLFFSLVVSSTFNCSVLSLAVAQNYARWQAPPEAAKRLQRRLILGKLASSALEKEEREDADGEVSGQQVQIITPIARENIPSVLTTPASSITGKGLVVTYRIPNDANYAALAASLKESGGLDDVVRAVNKKFDFPHVDVVFDMCGVDNAFYEASKRKITLCYELVASLTYGFRQDEELSDDEVGTQVIASLIFTFFHELGHAAIDIFDLPLTGNEEDAVDRFATLLLLTGSSDEDTDLAENAIGAFDMNTVESLEDLDFADEHLVDDQRWYTMACLMVGSDSEKYEYLVDDGGLPAERAEACKYEYVKIAKGWETLMKPHRKSEG